MLDTPAIQGGQDHDGEIATSGMPGGEMTNVALVVDDDALFRMALGTILTSRLGCSKVIEAASFDEALEQLSEHADISVALFDLSMPGIRNPANLKVVRETFPSVRTAVVSASISHRDVLMSLEAGVHGYVPKSLNVIELTAALKTIFEGTVYVPAFLTEISASAAEPRFASDVAPVLTLDALTPRQQDVLHLIVDSKSNKEMARILNLSEGTVKVHVSALFRNLGVNSRVRAAIAGARLLSGSLEGQGIHRPA